MIYKLYACTFPGKSWKYHHTQQQKKNKRNYMCINTSVVRSKIKCVYSNNRMVGCYVTFLLIPGKVLLRGITFTLVCTMQSRRNNPL